MTFVYLICFIVATIGIVCLLGLTPDNITGDIMRISTSEPTLKERVLLAKGKKKSRKLTAALTRIRDALNTTGIVSVFKIIQELLAPGRDKRNQFQQLMEMLPDDHKAKWFAGAALNTSEQSMASVMSTTLSRLNAFLDSELETIMCSETEIDAEKLCNEKSIIFVIMPEEDSSKYFMVSLIIQQLYREIQKLCEAYMQTAWRQAYKVDHISRYSKSI